MIGSNRWLIPIFQGTSEVYEREFRAQAEELGLRVVDPGSDWRRKKARRARFDWEFYVGRHRDLIPAGVDSRKTAKQHWRANGVDEFRVPNARFVNELRYRGSYLTKLLAGTIFCCRSRALLPFFEDFDIEGAISRLEVGLVKDGNGTIPRQTHFWERMFGPIIETAGYRLYGVEESG